MAVALLMVSALLVLGAVVSGSFALTVAAGVMAVALGGAATKITHSELADARVESARDRSALARDFAAVSERKTAENVTFALDMRRKISAREDVIDSLELVLDSTQRQVIDQTRKFKAEALRADKAESSTASSEDRAAEAIVVLAELEAEIDVLKAEIDVLKAEVSFWRGAASGRRASSA